MHQQTPPARAHSTHQLADQSGNAFWIILLAIALLVALTVTITKSGENTEESGQRDRDRIQASDILRQAKSMEQAIQKMRIGGMAENDISFDNRFVSGYENHNCNDPLSSDDDKPCQIFHTEGGGLTYKVPASDWLDATKKSQPMYGEWYIYANACIPKIGSGDAGCETETAATELIVTLPWIKKSLCVELNRLNGVSNLANPVRPPKILGSAYKSTLEKFTGTFAENSIINNADDAFKGKPTGCFEGDTIPAGGYHFYHTLLPR